MEQMLIVHISSLSAIIILSIVLLVNSIKTKNKLVMYLSIGTLVVSIGCLTYCLIHHFNDEHYKNKVKQLLKSLGSMRGMEQLSNCYNSEKSIKLAFNIFKDLGVTTEEIDRDINNIKNPKTAKGHLDDTKHLVVLVTSISAYCGTQQPKPTER